MRLQVVQARQWQVLAVCTDRGDCPLLDFLTGLEGGLAKDRLRMLRLIDRVADQGPPRNTEVSHQLSPGIWELIQGRLRVLWFYDEGRLIICSHGFVKKKQKTPRSELEKAQECHRQYFEAKAHTNLELEG